MRTLASFAGRITRQRDAILEYYGQFDSPPCVIACGEAISTHGRMRAVVATATPTQLDEIQRALTPTSNGPDGYSSWEAEFNSRRDSTREGFEQAERERLRRLLE